MSEPDITAQRSMWNAWNRVREEQQDEVPLRQAAIVCGWLDDLGRTDLDILDVGCGAGWLEQSISRYGQVTATDLADEVLERARLRSPEVTFVAGDFLTLPLPEGSFDVVVSLEVLSHVADQPAFLAKCADLLRPGGTLMLATQNRPVLERLNDVPPPRAGQLRRWVDAHELRALLTPRFVVDELFSVTLKSRRRHPIRALTSVRVDRVVRAFDRGALDRLRRTLERRGYGWTLMARARVSTKA
ncbi:hypothetical protein GCM10022415_00230 [Knoellia locipacati]|uniref:Methyltransferase type 11 domain-containing protein n=1 Tax=Knoellia locipacati TaxID=882824 RepID=A0A512SVJ4_9MICO|nr:methyltransferase domain-containing protein [Knoellia locipacati]GEQ11976.1 hypothetical protein KLO01_00230 [Knoellia locipacati]